MATVPTHTSAFTGFRPEAIQFFADLVDNNNRDWFQPRKAEFERLVKEPMEALVAACADRFAARGVPLLADPKKAVWRIYRDTRFSKDKSPYKRHLAANFPYVERAGGVETPDTGAHGNGGYFNFQPGEMYVGGGMWMPDKDRLTAFRRAVIDEPDRVREALEDPGFVQAFGGVSSHEPMKRVPTGFPADHPRADLLKLRDVVFGRRLSDEEVLSPNLPDIVTEAFVAAVPVFRFLSKLRGRAEG